MAAASLFIKSCIVGLAIAAPVGPIGFLCIRHTIDSGLALGLAVGLGAALADAVYGIIAAIGFSAVASFLMSKLALVKFVGGLFLLYLGIKEFRIAGQAESMSLLPRRTILRTIGSTFLLTLSNPMTLMVFMGIFSSLSGDLACSMDQSLSMVVGIFLGSMLWWIFLSSMVFVTRSYLPLALLRKINIVSGVFLILFGCYTLISIFYC